MQDLEYQTSLILLNLMQILLIEYIELTWGRFGKHELSLAVQRKYFDMDVALEKRTRMFILLNFIPEYTCRMTVSVLHMSE